MDRVAEGGGVLRQVGHDAIFAMHSIKAFRMLPESATPERVDGVCKLIRSFTPWRDVEPDERIQPPEFSDQVAASKFILKEASVMSLSQVQFFTDSALKTTSSPF